MTLSTDPPTPTRRRAGWDIALSIVLLVLSGVTALVGAVLQLFQLAFTDYCPRGTCHPDQGVAILFAIWIGLAVVLLLATVTTIILLVKRRRGWWVATIALVAVIVATVAGFLAYAAAVGY